MKTKTFIILTMLSLNGLLNASQNTDIEPKQFSIFLSSGHTLLTYAAENWKE